MKTIKIPSYDQFPLSVSVFAVEKPKAIVQMIHGLKEHKERYYDFIKALNKEGYSVVISDNRGHGMSIDEEYSLGYMNDFRMLIKDQYEITKWIKDTYPQHSLYLFGHSFGSMLARIYLQDHDQEIEKLILSGTANYVKSVTIGILLGNIITFCKGKKGYSKLLTKLMGLGSDSWVVGNEEVLTAYRQDPLCNYPYPNISLMTIFHCDKELHHVSRFSCQNPNLKIASFSGELDPITGGEKGLKDTIQTLEKIGYSDIQNTVYPGMKHEVLNELDNENVYHDIIKFLNR